MSIGYSISWSLNKRRIVWKRPLFLLSRFKNRDSHHLREVVTGNETWLYFFELDNKLNNKMWVGENNERPVVARGSVRRVIYGLFFDSDGIVACISVPENCSVTGAFYRDFVLSAIVNHYQAKRPRARVRGIKLLHNNAPAHRSAVVKSYLEVLQHPPNSPDLFPYDFWLNPYIKSWVQGRRFEMRSAVYQCINRSLKNNSKMLFLNGFPVQKNVSRSMESTLKVSASHCCKDKLYFHNSCCHYLKNAPRIVQTRKCHSHTNANVNRYASCIQTKKFMFPFICSRGA